MGNKIGLWNSRDPPYLRVQLLFRITPTPVCACQNLPKCWWQCCWFAMQYAQAFIACRTFTIKWKQSFATLEMGVVCFVLSFPMDCRQANNRMMFCNVAWSTSGRWKVGEIKSGEGPERNSCKSWTLEMPLWLMVLITLVRHTFVYIQSCLLRPKADVSFLWSIMIWYSPS